MSSSSRQCVTYLAASSSNLCAQIAWRQLKGTDAGIAVDEPPGRSWPEVLYRGRQPGGALAPLSAPLSAPLLAPTFVRRREETRHRSARDQEVAAWQAVRRSESALAVVDSAHTFVGLIPPDRLLAVLLAEHEEDLSRLGGILSRTSAARIGSEERIERRFQHRLPWLLLGLAGSLLAADLVASFASALERNIILAFFIPTIVYLADAVGTQTETVIVRGLSIGVRMRQMALRELATGVAIGLVIGVVAGVLVWVRWDDTALAISVMITLLAACTTATVTAMALPALFDALGRDPAFASGPLATVIQDLLSILIYFLIATRLMA